MTTEPAPASVPPSVPDRYDWDDDARTCARYSNDRYNRDEDS